MGQSLHEVEQAQQPKNGQLQIEPESTLTEVEKHALVEIMPSAIFTCDAQGLITYYNQRAAELWGRYPKLNDPEDRYCGSFKMYRPDGSFLPHEQCPMALAVLTGRKTRNEEIHIVRPDGTSIIVQVNIDPLVDKDGRIIGAINVFEDVTPRRQAEDALRISEERLRLATEAGGIGIFDYDINTKESYFSPLYHAITKFSPKTTDIEEWLQYVHPDDRDLVRRTVGNAIQHGEPYHYEYRIYWPDGSLRWIEVNGLVAKDEQGRPARLTGAMRDVTERKQFEERLHTLYRMRREVNRTTNLAQTYEQALNALEKVLYADRAAILLFDDQGVMRFQASRGLSEEYRQQVEGHSPWAVDEVQPVPVVISDVERATNLGDLQSIILNEGIRAIAFIPLLEQGKLLGRFMLYYNQPHRFVEAEIQWAQTIARDIAHAIRRKQAEDELRQLNATLEQRVSERTIELERSNRELDQFAYIASHDLKAPLRGIGQLAEWIKEDASHLLPEKSKEHLAKLHGRVRRMDMLLNDLLAYSRAGRQRHTPEVVDTAEVVRDVAEILTPPPGFTIHIANDLPKLTAERVPLETLFRCLVSNAIKHHHNPGEGRVEINAAVRGDLVEFYVTDNGPGIDPRFHQRIFEMFQTLQPRDQVEGSGVGLALVKKLVESRGGTVEVRSNPGEGSTFSFTWPMSASDA